MQKADPVAVADELEIWAAEVIKADRVVRIAGGNRGIRVDAPDALIALLVRAAEALRQSSPEPVEADVVRAAEAMRERRVKVCEDRAAYFDRAPAHRNWSDAARSYRATAAEIRSLCPKEEAGS